MKTKMDTALRLDINQLLYGKKAFVILSCIHFGGRYLGNAEASFSKGTPFLISDIFTVTDIPITSSMSVN